MPALPSGNKLRVLDALVVLWTLAWIGVGIAVGEALSDLTRLTGSFRTVGEAIISVGEVLAGLEIPILGGPIGRAADAILGAGRDVVARGTAVRAEIEQASFLVGAAVALAPTLPLLAAYGPARVARAREVAALRALLIGGAGDLALESFLATRALQQVSYRRLRRIATRPWEDDAATRRALAEEELRRLGVGPSRLDAEDGSDREGDRPP